MLLKRLLECVRGYVSACFTECGDRIGSEGTSRVQRQIENLHSMGVVDEDAFTELSAIMLIGLDGAHPHLPKLSPERASILLELMKDALYQLFVRKAKIEEAARLRKAAIASAKHE